jgi:acetylglutamate kinase
VDGVIKDGSLQSELSVEQTEQLIREGVIKGGMAPKVEALLYCVRKGVQSAQIINGTDPHSVIAELFTDEGIGTKIVA